MLKESERERKYRVASLGKEIEECGKEDRRYKRLLKLMKILDSCRKGERCKSPGCPTHMRVQRRRLVRNMVAVWPAKPEVLAELKFVTLLHEDWAIPAGKLRRLDPRTITDRLRKQLRRAGFKGVIIGGIDGTFDPDLEKWSVHLHFIAEGLTEEIERNLRRLYPPSEDIPRPMMVKPVKDAARQYSYVLKSFWNQRASYIDDCGRANTPRQRQRVPEPHHSEYLLWLNRFSVSDLMLLVGVRRYGTELQRRESCQRATTH